MGEIKKSFLFQQIKKKTRKI